MHPGISARSISIEHRGGTYACGFETGGYVDIFIGGCIEIDDADDLPNFAVDSVRTTRGWSKYWVNDRLMPRRPYRYPPLARHMDGVLQDTVPDQLKDWWTIE